MENKWLIPGTKLPLPKVKIKIRANKACSCFLASHANNNNQLQYNWAYLKQKHQKWISGTEGTVLAGSGIVSPWITVSYPPNLGMCYRNKDLEVPVTTSFWSLAFTQFTVSCSHIPSVCLKASGMRLRQNSHIFLPILIIREVYCHFEMAACGNS